MQYIFSTRSYCAILFWASIFAFTVLFLIPVPFIPQHGLLDWWDKAQHATVFAALMLLGYLAYPLSIHAVLWGLIGYGAAIELLQAFTGWRSGEPWDFFADAVGAVLAWLIVQLLLPQPTNAA
jgi:VanZ family protein